MSEVPTNSAIIALDAMGADKGPAEVLAGLRLARQNNWAPDKVVIVGKESLLRPLLREYKLDQLDSIELHPAEQVIGMGEKPIQSIRSKPDASMVRAIERVKNGSCNAAVSCGNTGSLMACATLKLRPIEGVAKPALASVWPHRNGRFVVLDVGANPQCRPENLFHYAVLGQQYARDALGQANPRVGLLSIGTEEGKGTEITNATHQLLKQLRPRMNYIGLIEGFQIFNDEVDVVVTDGFNGNILLKSCESLWKMLKGIIGEEVRKSPFRMAGALLMKPALQSTRARLDPKQYGGAPLLGLRGTVLKAHGSSDAEAIAGAIRVAATAVRHNLNSHTVEAIRLANQSVNPPAANNLAPAD